MCPRHDGKLPRVPGMTGTLPRVPAFAWLPTFREYLQHMPTCRACSGAVCGDHAPTNLVAGSRSGAVRGDPIPN
eukprot:7752933-Alexandrium_andersonii.AAC.1